LLVDIAVYFAALLAAFHVAVRYRRALRAPQTLPKPPTVHGPDH
jgi:hypothetical protein